LIGLGGPASIAGQQTNRPYRYNQEEQQQQQQSKLAIPAQPASTNILFSSGEDYHIGASDVLQIIIEDAPELTGLFRVNSEGAFTMPFLGPLKAVDRTPEELQRQIAEALRGEYLTDPQVRVAVAQYNSRSLFVQGAVRYPGVYLIEGKPSLLKLITMAGGLIENHGSAAYVIREIKTQKANLGAVKGVAQTQTPGSGGAAAGQLESSNDQEGKYDIQRININSLLKGNFSQNLPIQPGDIVNIPEGDIFFVAGEVRSPGSFPLKDGTTLRQAISLAQGITFKARPSMGIIFREDPTTGKRQEIKIDLGEIMSGKREDVPILANDIVIVPNSRFKTVAGTVLNAFGVNSVRIPMVY